MSYQQSQKISKEELKQISAAGLTTAWSGYVTGPGGWDGHVDVTVDY